MASNLKQNSIIIKQSLALPDELSRLADQARQEGFRFLDRLTAEFESGTNTFAKQGEALFEARKGAVLVGIGGLNRDPYVSSDDGLGIGRIRRLYVAPSARRLGVARLLMSAIEQSARATFATLRLRTDTEQGALFYARLGYTAIANDDNASHVKQITGG